MTDQERWHAFLADTKTGQLLEAMLHHNRETDAALARAAAAAPPVKAKEAK